MNKTEFLNIVKAAGIDTSAIENLYADGVVSDATIEIKNDAHLPSQIVQKGCGAGLFYSRVRFAGDGGDLCWAADAGYEWNDSQTTYGDEPACDPSPCFATLQEAAAEAVSLADAMAEDLESEVANMIGGEIGDDGKFSPQRWSGFARFKVA